MRLNTPSPWWKTATGIKYITPTPAISFEVNNTTNSVLVYGNLTEPQFQIHNTGGAGGATFRFTDDVSSADWKFKATNTGGFKIRDNAGATDPLNIQATCPTNTMWLLSSGNVAIGSATALSKLRVVGLPTSSAGLASGDIWIDTTGGLNILKIV